MKITTTLLFTIPVVMWSQERLLVRSISNHEVHKRSMYMRIKGGLEIENAEISPWWFVKVSGEDGLLEWSDIEVEHIKPLLVKTDLVHVDISRRHSFIATFQPLILKYTLIKG